MVRKREQKSKSGEKAISSGLQVLPGWAVHFSALVVVLFAGLFSYSNSFGVPFVLDDVTSILTNPLVKQFDFRLKTRIFGDLSFALNYQMGGLNPAGYHVVNLGLHLLNAGLVYLLVQMIFRTPLLRDLFTNQHKNYLNPSMFIGFGAALLFVTHPLQTQAVTYVAQRVAVMATSFYLGSLICYAASRLSAKRAAASALLLLSLLLAIAGVLTKENAVTIPVSILLFELTFFRGDLKGRLLPILCCLLPMTVVPIVLLWRVGLSSDLLGELSRLTAESGAASRVTYLLTQFPVIVSYLRLFFFPVGQNLDHDVLLRTTLGDPVVIASFILLAAVAAGGVLLWFRSRRSSTDTDSLMAILAFCIGWFFITLSVESTIIPIRDVMFEHRIYLPSVGIVIAISTAGWLCATRLAKGDLHRSATGFVAAFAFAGLLLGFATYARNRVWSSEVMLWQDVVKKSPGKARAHGSLGHAWQRSGNPDEAVRSYLLAIRLAPGDHIARNNLGTIYLGQNRVKEALEQFQGAVSAKPDSKTTHYNLGLGYAKLERFDEAAAAYREAIRLGGESDQLLNNLGIVLFRQGKSREALKMIREAVRLNPANREAAGNLEAIEKVKAH